MATFSAEKLKELQKIHYDATTPMDSYFTGIWNGMEMIISLMEERDPKYKSVEQLSFVEIKPQDAIEDGEK